MRRAPWTVLAVASLTLSACGNDRTEPPDVRVPPPTQLAVQTSVPEAGVAFRVPREWRTEKGQAPLVATTQTGQATVAVWRYPRDEQLPVDNKKLKAAKAALLAEVAKRDPQFKVERAKLLHVGPKRAVQVIGTGKVAGNLRRVRSTHIYTQGSEYVVDAYAPPSVFARVDAQVFAPLLESLKFTKPKA